jgi:hypothetical protein
LIRADDASMSIVGSTSLSKVSLAVARSILFSGVCRIVRTTSTALVVRPTSEGEEAANDLGMSAIIPISIALQAKAAARILKVVRE